MASDATGAREDRTRSSGTPLGRRFGRVSALAALVGVGAVLLAGCGGAASQSNGSTAGGVAEPAPAQPGRVAMDSASGTGTTGQPGGTSLLPSDRALIATASLTVRVEDVTQTLPRLTGVAAANGGYVSSEDASTDPTDPTKTTAVVVLRIPTPRMDNAVGQVAAFGDVLSRQMDVQDVTETVVDVNSRVQSARASVARIRILLDRAQSLSDVVRIESELARREADLESLLAQQRSLKNQTDFATVAVTLVGAETVAPSDSHQGFLYGLEQGWKAFAGVVVSGLTLLGASLPFLFAAAVVALPVWAWLRRRGERRPDEAPPQPDREELPVGR